MKQQQYNIDDLIAKAATEAIKQFDYQRRGEARKKVFHNTRLLLSHYNDLKSHVDNAIADISKLEGSLLEIDELERDELYILSIKRSKAKTFIMIAHIDMALETLKNKQFKLCALEKYEALKMFYIDGMKYDEIVKQLNCGVNTPRRWINEMINELSIYIFGIDGLKSEVV